MKLAYVCSWWRPVETTWSGISASLMNALDAQPNVYLTRVDAQHDLVTSAALLALGRARGYGTWKYSRPSRHLTAVRIRRGLRRLDVDAVLGVGGIEPPSDVPTFAYQDASFSAIRAHGDVVAEYAPLLANFPSGRLDDLVAEQRAAYAASAGVLTMGQWFADWLVEHDEVPRERVHAVGGGLHGLPARRDLAARGPGGTKVLFVGREFSRKGGDLVVSAIEQLRASGSGDFTLTVVGPAAWPMSNPVPEWIDFRGEVPAAEVRQMWAEHDIFAMPTWYEPYGLVFLEARAAGVPALGRAAYAMPELVPESAGRLIPPAGGVDAVADELLAISKDEGLFASVAAESDAVRASCGWDSVADRSVKAIHDTITS